MPILAIVNAEGMTKEAYEAIRKEVNWEGNLPKGAMIHIAGFDNKGVRAVDVWNSEEDYNNFIETRLKPALKKMNIEWVGAEIIQTYNINIAPQTEQYKIAQAQ